MNKLYDKYNIFQHYLNSAYYVKEGNIIINRCFTNENRPTTHAREAYATNTTVATPMSSSVNCVEPS